MIDENEGHERALWLERAIREYEEDGAVAVDTYIHCNELGIQFDEIERGIN